MTDGRRISRRRALSLAGASVAGGYLVRPELDLTPFRYDESVPEGTWPMGGRDPGRTGYAPGATPPTGAPSVRWRSDPGYFRRRVESIAVDESRVYVRGGDRLVAMDTADGRRQWELVVESGSGQMTSWETLEAGPVVGRNRVYVGNVYGATSVDASTGDAAWRQRLDRDGAPLLSGNTLYFATYGELAAVDATTGAVRWQRSGGGERRALALHDRRLLASVTREGDPSLAALDPRDGETLWSVSAGEDAPGWPAVVCTDGRLVASADAVRAFDVADGAPLWTVDDLSHERLLTDGERIYVLEGGAGVVALDAASGERRWRTYAASESESARAALTDDALYVAVGETVAALDPATGDELFSHRLGDGPEVIDLAATGGTLWVARENGEILGLEP